MQENFDPTMIDKLILEGAIEFRGVSEEGKILYGFTEEAKNIAPEAYNTFVEGFYKQILELWQRGFLNMDITKENPIVMPTQKAFNFEERKNLEEELNKALTFLIDAMKK